MGIGKDLYESSKFSRQKHPSIEELTRAINKLEADYADFKPDRLCRFTSDHWARVRIDLIEFREYSESRQISRVIAAGPNAGQHNPNYSKNRAKFDAHRSLTTASPGKPVLYAVDSYAKYVVGTKHSVSQSPAGRRSQLRQLDALYARFIDLEDKAQKAGAIQ